MESCFARIQVNKTINNMGGFIHQSKPQQAFNIVHELSQLSPQEQDDTKSKQKFCLTKSVSPPKCHKSWKQHCKILQNPYFLPCQKHVCIYVYICMSQSLSADILVQSSPFPALWTSKWLTKHTCMQLHFRDRHARTPATHANGVCACAGPLLMRGCVCPLAGCF